MNRTKIDRLRERAFALCGPTLKVFFADGSSRVVTCADAISLFKDGKATRAENNSGETGLLAGLLSALSENP